MSQSGKMSFRDQSIHTTGFKALFILLLLSVFLAPLSSWSESVGGPLSYLRVQDGGRVKPFDTFARESLRLVYGKQVYKAKDGTKREAVDVVMTWLLIPDQWDQMEFVEIRHSGLREALRLSKEKIFYTPSELLRNERLPLLFQELRNHRETENKLNPYFQDLQRLENQLGLYHAIRAGQAIKVAPKAEEDNWTAIVDLPQELRATFEGVTKAFIDSLTQLGSDKAGFAASQEKLKEAVNKFSEEARALNPTAYGSDTKIKTEVHYNAFHPFQWSWVFYLLGAILLVSFLVSKSNRWLYAGFVMIGIAFLLHTYGMVLRSYLTGRPPVSNMYETVVWVPWGAVVFAAILERFQRSYVILTAASLISVLCLILTDLAPTVLDSSLQPLEPVLRSTFWLTTHVLIITVSYAAFFLAFALGDLILTYMLIDEKKYAAQINRGVNAIYRSVQIGVVLLAAGTILGGVWADYSWGRFWGWDPKETWAFIALMGYLALLHGRIAGWIKNFGMAAGSVVSFSLVIMAWYGVNFVLGAGLHSYGFGAGGVEYVSAFVAVHILYVVFVGTLRMSRQKAKAA